MTPMKGDEVQVSVGKGKPFEVTVTGDGQCRSCESFVIWVKTPKGKSMPVDPRPDRSTGLFVSHFSTCEQASDWRKE